MATPNKLSFAFSKLEQSFKNEDFTLGDLLHYLKEEDGLTALFLSFPFLLPIPLPGVSIPFGILILVSGLEFLFGDRIKIPQKKILNRRISSQFFSKVFAKGQKFLLLIKKWVRPRHTFIIYFPGAKILQGLILITCGLLLSLPLPPGTNAPPASAIFFTCLGILEEDGVCCGVGYLIFALNIVFFSWLVLFGVESFHRLFGI